MFFIFHFHFGSDAVLQTTTSALRLVHIPMELDDGEETIVLASCALGWHQDEIEDTPRF